MNLNNKKNPEFFILWLCFFVYSVIFGFFFSIFILPKFANLQGPDVTYYNQMAINLCLEIKTFGWSHWRLFYTDYTAGQVSFLAILYYFFGENPHLLIPFSAFFHSLAGVLIYLIGINFLNEQPAKNFFAFSAAVLFLIFPSSMVWVSQINKESYTTAGFFLIFFNTLQIFSRDKVNTQLIKYCIGTLCGILLIACFRPYLLQIIFVIFLLLIFFQLIRFLPFNFKKLILYLALLSITFLTYIGFTQNRIIENELDRYTSLMRSDESWSWQTSRFIPGFIDDKLASLASARVYFINHGITSNAKSMIDIDEKPKNVSELMAYLPRAIFVSIFSPFPKDWFKSDGIVKITSSFEMFFIYISFIGLLFLCWFRYTYIVLICIIFTLPALALYGIVNSNIGSIYRIRYPYEMLLLTSGISGWNFFLDYMNLLKNKK